MSYKWCAVPKCTNTSLKTPEKLFVSVPKNVEVRRKWLQLSRRDPNDIAISSNIFFCEDHFDMENDMANYYQYKMGFSQKIILKAKVLPSKFHCQPDRIKRMCDAGTSRSVFVKLQRMVLVKQCEDFQQPIITDDEPITTIVEAYTKDADVGLAHSLQEETRPSDELDEVAEDITVVPDLPEFSWDKNDFVKVKDEENRSSSRASVCSDALSMHCDDTRVEDENYRVGCHCDVCSELISGFRYTCVQCASFDLCVGCEMKGEHREHYVLRVPGTRPYPEVQEVLLRIREYLLSRLDPIHDRDDISVKSEIKEENLSDVNDPIAMDDLLDETTSPITEDNTEFDSEPENVSDGHLDEEAQHEVTDCIETYEDMNLQNIVVKSDISPKLIGANLSPDIVLKPISPKLVKALISNSSAKVRVLSKNVNPTPCTSSPKITNNALASQTTETCRLDSRIKDLKGPNMVLSQTQLKPLKYKEIKFDLDSPTSQDQSQSDIKENTDFLSNPEIPMSSPEIKFTPIISNLEVITSNDGMNTLPECIETIAHTSVVEDAAQRIDIFSERSICNPKPFKRQIDPSNNDLDDNATLIFKKSLRDSKEITFVHKPRFPK